MQDCEKGEDFTFSQTRLCETVRGGGFHLLTDPFTFTFTFRLTDAFIQ